MKQFINILYIVTILSWVTGCAAGAYTGNSHLTDGGFMSFVLLFFISGMRSK